MDKQDMDTQDYEEMIDILTLIVNKQYSSRCGICEAISRVPGNASFYSRHISDWLDDAASGRTHYPMSTALKDKYISASQEYFEAQEVGTLYADTPYGDARRRLAAFLRSKAEEELALLVGGEDAN